MARAWKIFPALGVVLAVAIGCGNPPAEEAPTGAVDAPAPSADDAVERVTPPFPVRGDLDGLLLVWFDAEGQHSAQRRSDIPAARLEAVRVDSLRIPPAQRLDPDYVYVADLRTALADGSYAVTKRRRAWFEARVAALAPTPQPEAAALTDEGVTLYRTSWCGVCKSAASFFRSRDIGFVEKDVEKDPAAAAEMQKKARAAGKTPTGVPVIDFHGHILLGFQKDALDRLIRMQKAAAPG